MVLRSWCPLMRSWRTWTLTARSWRSIRCGA